MYGQRNQNKPRQSHDQRGISGSVHRGAVFVYGGCYAAGAMSWGVVLIDTELCF